MHQDDCISNFCEDCTSSLSTIYDYACLALQRNFLMVSFLLQLSWKKYPPWFIKEFHWTPSESRSNPLHKKWSFPLRIFSVNVIKSVGNCGFGHIYWRNPNGKLHFLCSVVLIPGKREKFSCPIKSPQDTTTPLKLEIKNANVFNVFRINYKNTKLPQLEALYLYCYFEH